MKRSYLLKMIAGAALVAALLPAAIPAQAVTTAVGLFYGGCGSFSVDVAVFGTQDNGGGYDKLRYNITDGNNNVLYQEDVTLKVGNVVGSKVFSLPYWSGRSASKNPVRFAVVQLDANGNTQHEVGFVTYNAPCLPAVDGVTRSGLVNFDGGINVTATSSSYLYLSPGGQTLPITTKQGYGYIAEYRSSDSAWVQITVGSNDLVWVPASSLAIDVNQLAFRPSHIFGSSVNPGANAGAVNTTASGSASVSGLQTTGNVRLRSGPGAGFGVVGSLPPHTAIVALARNSNGIWMKVTGNGVTAWLNSFYTTIRSSDLRNLPVASS